MIRACDIYDTGELFQRCSWPNPLQENQKYIYNKIYSILFLFLNKKFLISSSTSTKLSLFTIICIYVL